MHHGITKKVEEHCVRLSDRRRLTDKLTALFEPRHARQYGRISFVTKTSMGGSVATSKCKCTAWKCMFLLP